jgi:hypothetical protein
VDLDHEPAFSASQVAGITGVHFILSFRKVIWLGNGLVNIVYLNKTLWTEGHKQKTLIFSQFQDQGHQLGWALVTALFLAGGQSPFQ